MRTQGSDIGTHGHSIQAMGAVPIGLVGHFEASTNLTIVNKGLGPVAPKVMRASQTNFTPAL